MKAHMWCQLSPFPTPSHCKELQVKSCTVLFFLARARCLSAGLRYLRLTRLPRHDRGPVPGGNRSAASCLCTVLRRSLYHYATRSPVKSCRVRHAHFTRDLQSNSFKIYAIFPSSNAATRRLQCSTTQATFTNPSLLRATPLLRGSIIETMAERKPSIFHLPTSFAKQILTLN